jgi:transcription elongation GreA/GreB family factor
MSVAFRRESDEEHLEPTFEIPLPPGPNWVTARGLRLTQEKVDALEAVDTAAIAEDDVKKHRRELRYWRTRLATAELRPVPDAEAVAFGSRVTFALNGKEKQIAIVGDDEADPAESRIAFTAPLARAMMDAEEGEKVDFGGKPGAIAIITIEAMIEE